MSIEIGLDHFVQGSLLRLLGRGTLDLDGVTCGALYDHCKELEYYVEIYSFCRDRVKRVLSHGDPLSLRVIDIGDLFLFGVVPSMLYDAISDLYNKMPCDGGEGGRVDTILSILYHDSKENAVEAAKVISLCPWCLQRGYYSSVMLLPEGASNDALKSCVEDSKVFEMAKLDIEYHRRNDSRFTHDSVYSFVSRMLYLNDGEEVSSDGG